MNQKLSVIMPCYNCERTLREAVDSIFAQDIIIPFEVVMVNDGSTDGTQSLMKELAREHGEIILQFHEQNRGGGAARNTAVDKSTGDIILCLDSDDVLPPGVVNSLVKHMLDGGYDGVVYEESRYFFDDVNEVNGVAKNKNFGRRAIFTDLFDAEAGPLTTVNFLYTKEAFIKAGGYPENHGFDTQGFGFRFLSCNMAVGICPGSHYFHRQSREGGSYFTRVYESGEYSRNIYLIIEDAIYLFSNNVRRAILDYDIFTKNSLGENNLKSMLDSLYLIDKNSFLSEGYAKMMEGKGFDQFIDKYKESDLPEDLFCLGVCYFRRGEFSLALSCYNELVGRGISTSLVEYNKAKALAAAENRTDSSRLDDLVMEGFKAKRRKIYLNPNLFVKLLVSAKNWIKIHATSK